MSWRLRRRNGQWCVVEYHTGEVAACYNNRAEADQKLRELYMASIAAEREVAEG